MSNPSSSSAHPLGTPRAWAIDFGLIGFASGMLAPLLVTHGMIGSDYIGSTALAGAFIGAGLGAILPWLLSRAAAKIPFGILLFAGPAVGAIWGALTGLAGGGMLMMNEMQFAIEFAGASVILAAVAGAIQFTWLWLPYTLLRAKQRRTWGVVVLAMLTPVVGYLGLFITTLL